MTDGIASAIGKVRSKESKNVDLSQYKNDDKSAPNQLVFFFKPEMTSDSNVQFDSVLKSTLEILKKHNVNVGAIRVLSGDYLSEKDIMIQHYGVIASIAKHGPSIISSQAKQTLAEKFADFGGEVLGGHQFLARFPEFNAFSLSVLNDNVGTTRLAGGTYAMNVKVNGKPFLVLNPFSPYQLVPYTTSGNSIVVFEVTSSEPWAKLRGDVCGVTDPKDAANGSIRKEYLNKQKEFGLKEVSKSANGVHMSAGPLEGMVELIRFFDLKAEETAFGKLLKKEGFSEAQIKELRENPTLDVSGKKVSAFDLTEEKDAIEAAKLLKDYKVAS